ncbi:DUF4159 domain-containing protein [Isosphaeraceae bacterium EP7]
MSRRVRNAILFAAIATLLPTWIGARDARGAVTREQVERAIRRGVDYLKSVQQPDGSWPNLDREHSTGTTSLVVLALLTAGESPESPKMALALDFLGRYSAEDLNSTYAISLQTMVFAESQPERFRLKIASNVAWLERSQIRAGDNGFGWPGTWTYNANKSRQGDNSNTQYALLALNAASQAGVPVKPEVWALSRRYWEQYQFNDGSWTYHPNAGTPATASMTCAGLSSLIITGLRKFQGQETLVGETIQNCGKGGTNQNLQRGIDWMAANFSVGTNHGAGVMWKYYYLYGLERAGRLSGQRFFGGHDWYREGAEELVSDQDPLQGYWKGVSIESQPIFATSFALLFLAKGRSPVLINKLRHGPGNDWNNDVDDIRNMVGLVSTDWKHLLTWQVVDPNTATVEDMLQAPIVYFNGHEPPVFSAKGKKNLREYVEQGGFIFAEACCGDEFSGFDSGFRELMKELFPEPEYDLKPLAEDHAVWRSKHQLTPDVHPLWGIEHGCRTVVIYSPGDLSCFWNQMEAQPSHPLVIKAKRVGQNVIDYATGRELPADKLTVREVRDFKAENPKRGALRIAKLRHAGDWNVAPLAIPNLTSALRNPPLNFDVVINHYELLPGDPNLINYPLIYIHGRAGMSFSDEHLEALRRHVEPGGGTFFADAACGSTSFDASFRKLVKQLFPDNALEPIPKGDDIYTKKVGFDLSDSQYSKAAGGGKDTPELEGVKVNGRWAVIYSKYDIGCALERHSSMDCKGYNYESALKIAANIVIYSTLP